MASQEYGDYGPLLFTVASEQPPDVRTPRPVHSPLRESGTHSSARRSATPPGSIHMDTTPPQPPPIARLQDTFMAGAHAGAAAGSACCAHMTPQRHIVWACCSMAVAAQVQTLEHRGADADPACEPLTTFSCPLFPRVQAAA